MLLGPALVVPTSDRTMERTERLRCNRRECPQDPTRLQAVGNRRRLAGQEGLRSRHRRLITFARCSLHQRRWRY